MEQLRSEPCNPLWQEKAGSRLAYKGSPSPTRLHVPNGAHLGQFAERVEVLSHLSITSKLHG